MLFAVTAVAMLRRTREQISQPRTEQVDNNTNRLFLHARTPPEVEQRYESFWNDLNEHSEEVVKVIDVRIVKK